jgi:hypothetical protein
MLFVSEFRVKWLLLNMGHKCASEESRYLPKFTLVRRTTFPHHRSGWGYALRAIEPLLRPNGVLLDGFIEETFNWNIERYEMEGILPYDTPWVGFLHNPPQIPRWHEYSSSPQSILSLPVFARSLQCCHGLFTFSENMCQWLSSRVNVPVEALVHPTETPQHFFRMENFLDSERRVVQIGYWLRRLNSIAQIPVTRLRRTCLTPHADSSAIGDFHSLIAREQIHEPSAKGANWSLVDVLPRLDPAAYDELLSRSLVFLDLYDSIGSNTVIECIVRTTPLLCNPLPALTELLGSNYPFFFSSLGEAAEKAEDLELVGRAHEHLSKIRKTQFQGTAFRKSIAESHIYRSLPNALP